MNEWQYLKNSLHLDNYLNSTTLINTLESELTEQQRLNEKGCIENKITELEKELKKTRPVYEKKATETMLGILKYGSKALDKTLDERKEEIEIIKSKRNDIKKELERLSEFISDVVENFHR